LASHKTVVFYDDQKKLTAARELYPAAEYRFSSSVPDMSDSTEFEGGAVVFMLENDKLKKATENCRGLKNTDVSVLPGDAGDIKTPVPADCSKPRMKYLEIEISRICNLNCRGCCDFINLKVPEEPFYDFDRYCADLARVKELFWGIGQLRLLGGEPLLNPRVAEYAEKAREIFPDCDLRIVTNGLLLPDISYETLRRVREANCSFDISSYPPTLNIKKEIVSTLSGAGVKYNFSVPMVFFFRNVLQKPAEDPAPAFHNCIFTHCHNLSNGRLGPCTFAFYIYRFNRHFGTDYPENDYVDLYSDSMDGWQIDEKLSKPHPFCACCGAGMTPLLWKGHCSPSEARPEDWLIKDTFINTKIAPSVQHTLKKGALTLREKLRAKQDG